MNTCVLGVAHVIRRDFMHFLTCADTEQWILLHKVGIVRNARVDSPIDLQKGLLNSPSSTEKGKCS